MSIEDSHGGKRLTKPRLSDLGEGPTPEQVEARREQLRQNATARGSKEAVRAGFKAAAGEQVRKALGSSATPEESRLVAENALQLAADAQREVGLASAFVAHHATRFGVNAALAGFYTQKAAETGFASAEGLALVQAAHACEARAERAMVACAAAVKEFGKRGPKVVDVHAEVASAFGGGDEP